jgi:hypothetical protein
MAQKKITVHKEAEEELIYDSAVIYKRGETWHFRMWLANEKKYARKSLNTKNKLIALERGKENYFEIMSNIKQGKTYFSLTTKEGVEKFLENKAKEIGTNIKVGRYGTIKTHLMHWLEFIKKDTKLKDLHRMDCENYYLERNKNKKKLPVKSITLKQEMSTINTMMKWLFKHNYTLIDGFEFKKVKRIDKKDETLRRNTFTSDEIEQIDECIKDYCDELLSILVHDQREFFYSKSLQQTGLILDDFGYLHLGCWWPVTECTMRPFMVVMLDPFPNHYLSFL